MTSKTHHNVQGSICRPARYDLLQGSFAHVPEYSSIGVDVTRKLNSPISIYIVSSGVCPESCVYDELRHLGAFSKHSDRIVQILVFSRAMQSQ